MKNILFSAALVACAGVAGAQTMSPSTPMQGSPPNTNTPAPAAPATPMTTDDSMNANGSMTATPTKPMAGTSGTPATNHMKKHKKPKS